MPDRNFIIITPSYNQAHFLQQTLDSVLSQPEVLKHYVMDGGSTDNSVAVLKKYKDSRLEWQSKPDKGQTDAINKGIQKILDNDSLSDDTIVAYLNSDDYYLPDVLAAVADQFAQNPGKEWLVGDAIIVDQDNNPIQEPIRWYKKLWRSFLSQTTLGILNPIPQPAVFIKLSAIKKVGLFATALHYVMDYEYWLRLFEVVGAPICINQPLAAFRIHDQSKGGTGFIDQFHEQYQVAQQFIKNPLVLWLQAVHNLVIITVYRLIK
jgi:glycosyltransferase involved in cell wall biosynthesis